MNTEIAYQPPTVAEFIQLRADVDWGKTSASLAQESLNNSLFHVTLRDSGQLIGMARVIGDGALFFYIQDLIVAPTYQAQGYGKVLMQEVEKYLGENACKGATIGLFAAKGKEGFYASYGYQARTGTPLGKGMCKFV